MAHKLYAPRLTRIQRKRFNGRRSRLPNACAGVVQHEHYLIFILGICTAYCDSTMKVFSPRIYTAVTGIFLLLQGVSTLTALWYPLFDRAFPAFLDITRMVPAHSLLHIFSGLIALAVLRAPGQQGPRFFALGFGIFYTGLALLGALTHQPSLLHMQPFDHPFHLLLGLLGLLASGIDLAHQRRHMQP